MGKLKVLTTGGRGMLGRSLAASWTDFDVVSTDLPEGDITDLAGFTALLEREKPDAVVHCAAMTAVDACETDCEQAFRLNAEGSGNVGRACAALGIRSIMISTDYVFDGKADHPYSEDDEPAPQTVYGQSKLAGETLFRAYAPHRSVVVRTAWLYGPGGPSFVHTMLKLADGSRPELKVVSDQRGNPTSTAALAGALHDILQHGEVSGVVHASCEGECSWYEFACEIFRMSGRKQKVVPCSTAEFPRPAPRPANSRLVKKRLAEFGLPPMQDWREALREFLKSETV